MTFEQRLKRWLSYLLPLVTWRVPVSLRRGPARASGEPVTLLAAGNERVTGYITQRLFAQPPDVQPVAQAPLWTLPKLLNRLQPSANLMVVGVDRLSARLFLDKGWLTSPAWVASWMRVPDDLESLARDSKSVAEDLRVVRKERFECDISRDEADFETFYDRFYAPYISKRHGELTFLRHRWVLRREFRRGELLWVHRGGERHAGDIITLRNRTLHLVASGVLDGRTDLLRKGAVAALYVHAIQHARRQGCAKIFLGGSRPSLHDGLFRYKNKWGAAVCEHPEVHMAMLLRWNRLEGPVAGFLSHTSIIHLDRDGLSALWAVPRDLPLTAERIEKEYRAINTTGLRRFRILLPGEPPPGFACPPDVRLIPLPSMAQAGPDTLCAVD